MKSFTQDIDELDELTGFLEEDLDNINRVISFCRREGIEPEFEVHAKAETCKESADHSPIDIDQIVKTLVFMAEEPVAVLCPGDSSVSERKLEEILKQDVRMANPAEVKEATGYPVGAVSPFDLDIKIIMEKTLEEKEIIRPAAGSRAVGANLKPERLQEAIEPDVQSIKK